MDSLDRDKLWEDLEMKDNNIMQGQTEMKKEAWNLVYMYQIIFLGTNPDCTVEAEARDAANVATLPKAEPSPGCQTGCLTS